MSKNESLLSMMPVEAQKQVLLLIKRLGDEKQTKEQAQRQCVQYEAEINELKKELEKLKKENVGLKAKWQNSFSMISKVRENFSGSKKGQDEDSDSKKKLRFNKEQCNWEEESEQEDESTQDQLRQNNRNTQPVNMYENRLKQKVTNVKFFSIESPHPAPSTFIQTSRQSQQPVHCQSLPKFTNKKPPRPHQQSQDKNSLSKSKLNITARSNKKLEIECLKQQIDQLTEEIKSKETGSMSLGDKIKKCEEIKNRYRKGGLKGSESQEDLGASRYEQGLNGSMVSGYYSPIKDESRSDRKGEHGSFIDGLASHHKSQQFHNSNTQKPYNYQSTNPSLTHSFNHHQSLTLKQNMQLNTPHRQPLINNSFVHNNSVQDPSLNSQQYSNLSKNYAKQAGTGIKKTSTRPVVGQQAFYDDGLLDLIAEMNP